VEEFHNNIPGSMLTIVCEVSDRAGILSSATPRRRRGVSSRAPP
jgi:hypothetical protein